MHKKGWLYSILIFFSLSSLNAMEGQISSMSDGIHEEDAPMDLYDPYSAIDFAHIYDQIFESSSKEFPESKPTFIESITHYILAFILSKYFELQDLTVYAKERIQLYIAICKKRLGYEKKRRKT